jgi:hypothetical protein
MINKPTRRGFFGLVIGVLVAPFLPLPKTTFQGPVWSGEQSKFFEAGRRAGKTAIAQRKMISRIRVTKEVIQDNEFLDDYWKAKGWLVDRDHEWRGVI